MQEILSSTVAGQILPQGPGHVSRGVLSSDPRPESLFLEGSHVKALCVCIHIYISIFHLSEQKATFLEVLGSKLYKAFEAHF